MKKYQQEVCTIWEDLYFYPVEAYESIRQEAFECLKYDSFRRSGEVWVEQEDNPGHYHLVPGYTKVQVDEQVYDIIDGYRYAEEANLDKDLPAKLFAYGSSGRWNGTTTGADPIERCNLNAFLDYTMGGDYQKYYVENEDVVLEEVHHDGTNHAVFRMVNPKLTEEELDDFYDLLEGGRASESIKYTVPIGDMVRKVYGCW